jgi:hypothetical protein
MLITALFLAAANIVLWALFFILYRRNFSASAILAQIRDEVNALLMDIRHETDLSATILKERVDALKALIAEADSRTLLAQKSKEQRQKEQLVIDALSQGASHTAQQKHALNAYRQNAAEQAKNSKHEPSLFDSIAPAGSQAKESAGQPKQDAQPAQAVYTAPIINVAKEQITPKKSIKTQALELAASGFRPADIAEKLKITVTEAQLIVDLYAK